MQPSSPSFGKQPPGLGRPPGGGHAPTPSVVEKARLSSLRRSTPDSEAIMSSDDEHELVRSVPSLGGKSVRPLNLSQEGSWLNEIQSGPPRRPSATTTTSNVSQPATPLDQASDSSGWPFQNALGRVVSNPVTTSWTSSSPWATAPSRIFGDERTLQSASRDVRDQPTPFSIAIPPTMKTSRSQSYSVGQMEGELHPSTTTSGPHADRQRRTPSQQLPHRPSRPSMLSEVYEGVNPESLAEHFSHEPYGYRGAIAAPRSPEGKRENVGESSHKSLLRHATMPRARHSQSASASDSRGPINPTLYNQAQQHHTATYPAEQIIDEEPGHHSTASLTRRFSELTGLGGPPNDAARRSQWQTSLGFGALPDIPQSRRHSMAEMPTRRNSMNASVDDPTTGVPSDVGNSPVLSFEDPYQPTSIQENQQRDLQNRNYAASYFSGVGPALRSRLESVQSPVSATDPGMSYHSSPPQAIFSRPSQDTPLYLVSFKCARAEVYYVADNTGLEVKEGDLVIVEADRGHDLGTVLNARISWNQAKELKNKANEEHYRWLMMFSRHNQSSDGSGPGGTGGMMAGSFPEAQGSASLGGPSSFGTGVVESGHRETELKPKMIKRLAQPHEVATLRDKEGNEAKAKRICQQKVNEMKLDMEVLDAEFQTDWKKLTFFYFANSYVNFNALVTDLFKVYKTRIWMSAVNPASLNTAPVPPPRGLGPGAVAGRDSSAGTRSGGPRPYAMGVHSNDQMSSSYQTGSMSNPYDHNNLAQGSHADYNTPAQQAYEMMQYGASQAAAQAYNPAMQSYGWGGFGNMTSQGLGGPYSSGPMHFSHTDLGPPRSRGTPGGHASSSNGMHGGQGPISPPNQQTMSYRKG